MQGLGTDGCFSNIYTFPSHLTSWNEVMANKVANFTYRNAELNINTHGCSDILKMLTETLVGYFSSKRLNKYYNDLS